MAFELVSSHDQHPQHVEVKTHLVTRDMTRLGTDFPHDLSHRRHIPRLMTWLSPARYVLLAHTSANAPNFLWGSTATDATQNKEVKLCQMDGSGRGETRIEGTVVRDSLK
jgi:hypothetical protein